LTKPDNLVITVRIGLDAVALQIIGQQGFVARRKNFRDCIFDDLSLAGR
jgi:hypothetical protein